MAAQVQRFWIILAQFRRIRAWLIKVGLYSQGTSGVGTIFGSLRVCLHCFTAEIPIAECHDSCIAGSQGCIPYTAMWQQLVQTMPKEPKRGLNPQPPMLHIPDPGPFPSASCEQLGSQCPVGYASTLPK